MRPGDDDDDPDVPIETVSKVDEARRDGKDVIHGSEPPVERRDTPSPRGDDD